MCIKVSTNLSITSWNVNGLFKRVNGDIICKLDDHQFSEVMNSDIVTFSETHASSDDILAYNGFKCYINCRKSETNRARVGLAIFVKKDMV